MKIITNPWKGLASYEEQDADKFEFCGRTQAIGKYYSLITDNLISTLYGKTGCGKTSLLQAGIFPVLRHEAYFPVMCRLSLKKDHETFSHYIISRVQEEAQKNKIRIDTSTVPVKNVEQNVKYNLWRYFYGHEFRNETGDVVFPIIVLDQFEEVLINNRDESLFLLEQLNYLVGDDLLLPEDSYANFRVTISMREDFLYLLEDALDYAKLPLLRENRMRLSPLNYNEAGEVVALGREMFVDSEYSEINSTIIRMARGRRGQVSTNMLSLICSQIYEMYENEHHRLVTVSDIEKMGNDPLRDFYLDCTKHISPATCIFIEDRLVLNEFRCPVTLKEFEMNVPTEDRKTITEGKYKIVQVITAGENECIELIHDSLARTIDNISFERKKRKKEKRINTEIRKMLLEAVFCLLCGALWIVSIDMGHQVSIAWGIVGSLLLGVNWLFSVATYGKKRYSVWHIFPLWLFNVLFALCVYGADAEGEWSLIFALIFIYVFCIPIVNLFRLHTRSDLPKLRYFESFRYIFSGAIFRESEVMYRHCLLPVGMFATIAIGILSYYFMTSWTLWVVLPFAAVFGYSTIFMWMNKKAIENRKEHRIEWLLAMFLMLFFVFSQHIAGWSIVLTIVFFILFGLLAIYSAFFKMDTSTTILRRCLAAILIGVYGAFFLPRLYLGYDSIQFGKQGYARCWRQPKTCSQSTLPYFSVCNGNGLSAIASRHNVVMPALYQHIDSVQCDSTDITLYTASGNYSWSEMYADRCPGPYLNDRIRLLEEMDCSGWEEVDYDHIAELATAYRIQGHDSLANALALQYYLRRMLQAEMYAELTPSRFRAEPYSCTDIMNINVDRAMHTQTNISYYQDFIDLANRIPRVLFYAKMVRNATPTVGELAYTNFDDLLNLLHSFRTNTVPYEYAMNQLAEMDDFLYLTRDNWGPYFLDSIFVYAYGRDYEHDSGFHIGISWDNIFLQRYELAQTHAEKSVQLAPENYLTYTNLQTSLFLSGQTDSALESVRLYKDSIVSQNERDYVQWLFPLQALGPKMTEGEGVVQDIRHFVRTGVLRDTTTSEFRALRHELEYAFSLPGDQGILLYPNGWNLSKSDDAMLIYNDDGKRLPIICDISLNILDSTAICYMEDGKYAYLNLRDMTMGEGRYDFAWHYSEDLAAVRTNDSVCIFIDRDGNQAIDIEFPSEPWLEKDHYKLGFHGGKAAVMNSNKRYYVIDKNGNSVWEEGTTVNYLRLGTDGFIGSRDRDSWGMYSWSENFSHWFDEECQDIILYDTTDSSFAYVYNHYDVGLRKHADDMPEMKEISGMWYCLDDDSRIAFAGISSNYVWLGHSKGQYFFSQKNDATPLYLCFVSNFKQTNVFRVTFANSSLLKITDTTTGQDWEFIKSL